MAWIWAEPLGLFGPVGADDFIGCEAFEGLTPGYEIVGADKVGQVVSELFVGVVVELILLSVCVDTGSVRFPPW